MPQVLEILQDTLLKRRPMQSSQLGTDEYVSIAKGKKFELQSYAYADPSGDDFDDHIKFAMKNAPDFIKGFNTWYVYELHAQVLQDGVVVYPQQETDSAQTLKILRDTVFKRSPVLNAQLATSDIYAVKAGKLYDLQSYAYADADGKEFNDHIKFALDDPKDYIKGLTTWFVAEQDIQVLLDGEVVYGVEQTPPKAPAPAPTPQPSTPKPSQPTPSGKQIVLPGYSSAFFLNQPIVPGSSFSWADATKNGARIPKTKKVVDYIIALATALERPRTQIGKPFIVTSWYRPPEINRATPGSAKNSQHMYGKAIDFKVPGMNPQQVKQALDWWPGGLGTYRSWNHLDIGPKRRWNG